MLRLKNIYNFLWRTKLLINMIDHYPNNLKKREHGKTQYKKIIK
jgi:hypothetical protein